MAGSNAFDAVGMQNDNVDMLAEKIKAKARLLKSQQKKDEEEIMSIWSQIMEASFVRFIAANWILPMGFLVTRVVLGLMGKPSRPH